MSTKAKAGKAVKAKSLELKVGGIYKDRLGMQVGPMKKTRGSEAEDYPFTDGYFTYKANGSFTTLISKFDLVRKVKPRAAKARE